MAVNMVIMCREQCEILVGTAEWRGKVWMVPGEDRGEIYGKHDSKCSRESILKVTNMNLGIVL